LARIPHAVRVDRENPPQNPEQLEKVIDPPVFSYLHRHTDKRTAEYFSLPIWPGWEKKVLEDKISRRFEIASALVADHPDDLYSRLLFIEMLSWRKDRAALAAQIKEWEPRFADSNLAFLFAAAKHDLRAYELSAAGRNAADLLASIFTKRCDLASAYRRIPEVLNYTELTHAHALQYPGNFLPYQVLCKSLGLGAVFMMLEGRREDALCILMSVYHVGQLLSQNDYVIHRLIGIAIRGIACSSLELFALNCCETPADCERLWRALEQLNQWEKADKEDVMGDLEGAVAPRWRSAWLTIRSVEGSMEGIRTRLHCAQSQFQLIRATVAGRHHFLRTGAFPRNASEFAPLLPAGPPPDPHKPSEALGFRTDADQFLCYSVGPDQKDDAGTIVYDPTNGTKSQGDVVVRMPRERKYPFPRGGVRAANREDLLRQFPNGLPPDPFSDTRQKQLEVTDSIPVFVYSYGPDTDESGGIEDPQTKQRRKRAVTDFPEVAYDPTNGTTSNGDLFIEIPSR
jgi:hypothetical protein